MYYEARRYCILIKFCLENKTITMFLNISKANETYIL